MVSAIAIAVCIPVMCFQLLVSACANCPVEIVIALLVSVEYVRGQGLYFIEVIILKRLREGNNGRGGVLVCTPLPLADVVSLGNGCLECCESRNVSCGQGLIQIGIDSHGLDQVAAQVIEVYGVQILFVVDCIVGEVVGGEYQRIRILGEYGLVHNAVLAYVVNVAVELVCIFLKGNGDRRLTLVKCRADQIKAVNGVVFVVAYGSGPLSLFTDYAGDCKGDLVCSSVCLDVVQCLVIQKNGNGICTCVVACCNYLEANVAIQSSEVKENGRNDVSSSPTVTNQLVSAHLEHVRSAYNGNVAIFIKVRMCAVCRKVICVSSCLSDSSAVLCIPTNKGVGVIQVHTLSRCCGCGGHSVVLDLYGINQHALCIEVYGCVQLCLVGGVCSCGNDCLIPALEGQNACNCFDPSSLGSRSLTVGHFDLVRLIRNDKGNVSTILCYVGSIAGNCRQLKAVACPTLEVQRIKEIQLRIQRRNFTVCKGLGIDLAKHVKGNRKLIGNLLDSNHTVLCGHCGQYVAVLVHCNQRVAGALKSRVVRSKLCAVRQEAFKDQIALFVYKCNAVQVSESNIKSKLGGDITGGNVIAQGHGSAVSGDGDLIQHVLDPCAGVIGCVKCKAEGTVALVGISQLGVCKFIGHHVEHKINHTVNTVVQSLCLSGIGNSVLVVSERLYHALHDILCASGADVQLVCNASCCCIKLCAANESVCILKLRQSSQIIVSNQLGQLVYGAERERCLLTVYGLGSLFDKDVTVLLEQLECGTSLLDLCKHSLFLFIKTIYVIKQVFNHFDKLIVLKQIKQCHQFANGCTFAQTLDDRLLGLIGNACVVESLCKRLGECTGHEDINVHVTARCDHVIHNLVGGVDDGLCALADQVNIALESNVELDVKVMLAVCTQRNVVRADYAVITHIGNVLGSNQVGKQCVLDAGSRNNLTVVACLHGVEQLDQLACAVAVDTKHLVAVDVDGVGLAVVHVQCGGLQEGNDCFLIHARCAAASDVTQQIC